MGLGQISGGQGAGISVHILQGLPEVANICPLRFICTKGVHRSHKDAEDGCGGESRTLHTPSPHLDTICSQLDR